MWSHFPLLFFHENQNTLCRVAFKIVTQTHTLRRTRNVIWVWYLFDLCTNWFERFSRSVEFRNSPWKISQKQTLKLEYIAFMFRFFIAAMVNFEKRIMLIVGVSVVWKFLISISSCKMTKNNILRYQVIRPGASPALSWND